MGRRGRGDEVAKGRASRPTEGSNHCLRWRAAKRRAVETWGLLASKGGLALAFFLGLLLALGNFSRQTPAAQCRRHLAMSLALSSRKRRHSWAGSPTIMPSYLRLTCSATLGMET